ncbi:MAG: efflux RND transporter periplasmic adaptor subunit [Candidatus Binatus sp.]|uniref:efflux RND transporter periplasmic adaptor subunit n=1 Tax=Candidatus Binatus sp. TaxID=2811406 RepID=UPI00271A61C6|nr:efflux RND transporter periplasmic adaptor subunit [Candidatus Binatus sp.]MDO8432830.1 efflux RND transporter periplasmic adaptor subunit [Candidatus Binatus sp.]
MKRLLRSAIALAALALLVSASGCGNKNAPASVAPIVAVAKPVSKLVNDHMDFTGNTVAIDSVTLVARVEGFLEKIHFTDGARVKKGDSLFTIQQSQYQAQLQQAEAQVKAQQAALFHAKTEFARYSGLLKEDATSQVEVDHWHYERDSAAAGLLAAQAQVQIAQLNLGYTLVRAPFNGRIGRHLVNPGNLVGSLGKQTALAEIDQIDPIYAYFTINERDLLRVMAGQRDAGKRGNPRPLPVFFGLANEEGFPHEGRLDFASISVTPTTGTLQLRGIFPNKDLSVLPGLFVRVRVPDPEKRAALLVPGDAVSFDQQGEYVLLVNNKNVVERRGVKTGFQVGDMMTIESGLKPDDNVIVEGLLQAIPGREVNPQRAQTGSQAGSKS